MEWIIGRNSDTAGIGEMRDLLLSEVERWDEEMDGWIFFEGDEGTEVW